MKLEELMKMSGGSAEQQRLKRGFTTGTGRGRTNRTTGQKGIHKRSDNTRHANPFQVYTTTPPAVYIGAAPTMEAALKLQRDYVPPALPVDCAEIPGVSWAGHNYRAFVTIKGAVYRRRGFVTPEAAVEWLNAVKAEHGA
jgi:hypothetical protein